MSDYGRVRQDLHEGVSPDLLCATCPWDRQCVSRPTVTTVEVERHIAEAEAEDRKRDPRQSGMPVVTLLTALGLAGRDSQGELCPVFALRLSGPDGRQVADGIRLMMRASVGGGQHE